MNTARFHASLLLAAALALVPAAFLRADESTSHIDFSDPSKPGTLKIRVWHGEVSIHGSDAKDITVKSDTEATGPAPRKDGMRVLSASSSFSLSEKNNVVSLEYGVDGSSGGSADFDITVPRSTSIIVANSARGDFECSGVSGDIDVRTMSGDVKLDQVCGGALIETMSGDINVSVKALAESKPLSFTSMHGEITIRVPADTKAAIRFRTHRGVILTNFDDKSLVTRAEISRHSRRTTPKTFHPESPRAPDGPAASGADSSAAAPRSESDDDWRSEVRDSIRQATEEAAEATRDAVEAAREGLAEAHFQLTGTFPPIPPIPPLPPMTGGKTVAGTLNGGGVEIQAATLNGDIILKKTE